MSNLNCYSIATHRIWSSHVAQVTNFENCLRSLQPVFTKLAKCQPDISSIFHKNVCTGVVHIFRDYASFVSLCFREKKGGTLTIYD